MSHITITEADEGKTFVLSQGNSIVITLSENPGTGYQWAIESLDLRMVELQSSTFSLPSNAGVGGGGERVLTFKTKATGMTQLQLKEWRPWEGDRSIVQRFKVTLQIQD